MPWLGKTLSNLTGLESQPCSEQKPGPDGTLTVFEDDQDCLPLQLPAGGEGELYTACTAPTVQWHPAHLISKALGLSFVGKNRHQMNP